MTIDILSIGSKDRPESQNAQQRTFGSHDAVRRFYRVDEEVDVELHCHTNLTLGDVRVITEKCRRTGPRLKRKYSHLNRLRKNYARFQWLERKANPIGWMCAQKRPSNAFYTLMKNEYYSYLDDESVLPDYLLIVDDDTYLQLDAVQETLSTVYPSQQQQHQAFAVAGCMVRSKPHVHNFTMPFGGYGMFLSRRVLENFLQPLYCNFDQNTNVTSAACRRLKQNLIGEYPLYKNGMSIMELMNTYVSDQPYTNVHNWNQVGFCMHSDWVWGYFINFYFLADHTHDVHYATVLEDRMHGYHGSVLQAGRSSLSSSTAQNNQCHNKREECNAQSHICHYVEPDQMDRLHAEYQKQKLT